MTVSWQVGHRDLICRGSAISSRNAAAYQDDVVEFIEKPTLPRPHEYIVRTPETRT